MTTNESQPVQSSMERAEAAAPGLDPAALAGLAALDPTGANRLLERVLQAFQTSAARLMPQLDAARLSGDRATIHLVAHTLKSSSGSIGAIELSLHCARVETVIRAESGDELDASIDAMCAALATALNAIQRLLDDRS